MIPLSVPCLNGREWECVKECLDTNWVSYQGPFVERFESDLAVKAGAGHAVAMSSGTAALHIALLLAGVRRNDLVVMPGLSFVAPANAVRYCGADPVFTDIRPDDWQWDADRLGTFLDTDCHMVNGTLTHRVSGRRIAALLPVHLLGGMCDADTVAGLAARYELPLIEDAAECLGASYRGRPIGAPAPCYSGPMRLVITSFNGNKIITTGGGGALFTDDEVLAEKARHLSTTAKADAVEFRHDEVGYNYRLSSMAAALGIAQLAQLEAHVDRKRAIAARYTEAFSDSPEINVHPEPAECRSTFWMYTVSLDRAARPLIDNLNACGVMSRPLWTPLASLSMFKASYCSAMPVLEDLFVHAISLPCSAGLRPTEQQQVIDLLSSML